MSTKDLSQVNSGGKARTSMRKIRKFKFTDLNLSFQVRKRLYQMIITIDNNVSYEFQAKDIKKALHQILDQSQSQVAYVIKNVFRYDTDHDGLVTYQQFSNFCLQQHFGQMAIQRLHKSGVYNRGNERLMSQQQFIKTIEYCLSFINIKPTKQTLHQIFKDIDLDIDGFITYVQYFTFLKQFFGSQSQSATTVTVTKVQEDLKKVYGNVDRQVMKQQIFKQKKHDHQPPLQKPQKKPQIIPKPPLPPPVTQLSPPPSQISPTKLQQLKTLSNKISRPIYHQLKIIVMEQDRQMTLCLNQQSSQQLLTRTTRIPQNKSNLIVKQIFKNQQTISYQKLVSYTIQKLMCQDILIKIDSTLNKQKFINQIVNNLFFVKCKPLIFLLQELFDKYNEGKNKSQINKNQFKQLMDLIFKSYNWPRKTGQASKKQHLLTKAINGLK